MDYRALSDALSGTDIEDIIIDDDIDAGGDIDADNDRQPVELHGLVLMPYRKRGKPVYRMLLDKPEPQLEPEPQPEARHSMGALLEAFDASELQVGATCPKCNGTGRYVFSDGRSGPCFACHDPSQGKGTGKGYISGKDMAYNSRHVRRGTLYAVKSC